MSLEPSPRERWRRLFGTDDGVELRIPGDVDRLLVRAWLGARIAREGPRWVDLPAQPAHAPGARERGPGCPGCGVGVDRREALRACTACLRVAHRRCHQLARGCAACGAADLGPPSARAC